MLSRLLSPASITHHACAGVRQTAKLRQRFLHAALAQDIPFYDTTLTSGAVIAGLNVDCAAVQAATSERVGHAINNLTQFTLSFALAFARGWKLSLMMLAVFPLLAVAGAIMAKTATYGTQRNAAAYAAANSTATQAVAHIRTVAAFQAEDTILGRYAAMLVRPTRVAVRVSTMVGSANGSVNATVAISCVPAFAVASCLRNSAPACVWPWLSVTIAVPFMSSNLRPLHCHAWGGSART